MCRVPSAASAAQPDRHFQSSALNRARAIPPASGQPIRSKSSQYENSPQAMPSSNGVPRVFKAEHKPQVDKVRERIEAANKKHSSSSGGKVRSLNERLRERTSLLVEASNGIEEVGFHVPPLESDVHTIQEGHQEGTLPSHTEKEEVFVQKAIERVYKNELPSDIYVVDTIEKAKEAASQLLSLQGHLFACDTEVMDIDVARQSPCCHGRVICFSVCAGPDIHFGPGSPAPGQPTQRILWVDTYLNGDQSRAEEAEAIASEFQKFWASKNHLKVWHNYSFDRHVLERSGLSCFGFAADTMHMARLWDTSRMLNGGYSLEALSSDPGLMKDAVKLLIDEEGLQGKVSMKSLFAKKNIKKDGTEGKLLVLPPVDQLQNDPETRYKWIKYSAYDAKSTYELYQALLKKLSCMKLTSLHEGVIAPEMDPAVMAEYSQCGVSLETMLDVYNTFWKPFGDLLTDMEASGVAVDRPHLEAAQKQADYDQEQAKEQFRSWAASKVPDALYMNVGSGSQILQLLFGGASNRNANKPPVPLARMFKVPNQRPPEGERKPKKNMDIELCNVWGDPGKPSPLIPEVFTPSGAPACSTPVLKSLAGKAGRARTALADLEKRHDPLQGIEGLRSGEEQDEEGNTVVIDDWPTDDIEITASQAELQHALAKKPPPQLAEVAKQKGYGLLFPHFDNEYEGLRACAAVDSLVDASAIDTLLSNFIVPLQSSDISKPDGNGVWRVHCSLNINTETGRLSARRPNLQNQPALEKDRYKVRKAFTSDREAGKTLIVADYGQLELRILAHMADCDSMIEAFRLGGDFHSRTALSMYDHIQKAVQSGECLLEWDGGGAGHEPPPAPLLKDMFASERRKAKVLNFSIAYGKTAHGLSKDWGTDLKEAQDTVARWYADRKQVEEWQRRQQEYARQKGYVCTLLGRRRNLPDAQLPDRGSTRAARAHAMRAAINTPIQGSAADVATAAMLRISNDTRLKELGWKLLLQVHDEVILEGPKESAEEAQKIVVQCMAAPFTGKEKPLKVDLVVDSKFADTWYDAK